MSYDYVDSLPPEDKGRYLTKLGLLGLDKCPFQLPADRWINDPKQWPKIEYSDVYLYLIKSPRLYSPEAMENYRSTDAHKFFVSGWVQTVLHIKLDSGDILLKADVKRSYCVTETPHHAWLALKKSGPVIYGHCDCMAGLGETCSHVGAMLYKMEAAVRLGYTSSACTDLPCQWNACFVQNVQPSPIADIRFYKEASKDRLKKSTKRLKTMPAPSTITEQHEFLSSLANVSESAVGLSTFSEYNDRFVGLGPTEKASRLPQPLRTLYVNGNETASHEKITSSMKDAADSYKLCTEDIMYVEEVTRSQSTSTVWHEQRAGRITSSTVSDILRTNITQLAPSLLKKICQTNMTQIKVPAIEWGNKNEHNAFLLYENVYTGTGHKPDVVPNGQILVTNPGPHQDCEVVKSGFVISEERPFLGVSPDGVVKCSCCGNGLLEIKCPYKIKDRKLQDSIADGQFYINSSYQLKQDHQYYAQVQLQMLVCEVNYVDFLVWTPLDCLITRVTRNDVFINEMIPKLESVWRNHILAELVSRKLEKGTDKENIPGPSHDISKTSDKQTFCLCKVTEDEDSGPMVACDRCDQWFHLACVGLKRLPSKKSVVL